MGSIIYQGVLQVEGKRWGDREGESRKAKEVLKLQVDENVFGLQFGLFARLLEQVWAKGKAAMLAVGPATRLLKQPALFVNLFSMIIRKIKKCGWGLS